MNETNILISQWQNEILDQRLKAIEENPELIKPIQGVMEILNREDE